MPPGCRKSFKWLAMGLELFGLMLVLSSAPSSGFLFWPNKLVGSSSFAAARQRQQQEVVASTITTTTTTTTTTPQPRTVMSQPPPIELHFEIQAEPVEVSEREPEAQQASNLMDLANGSLILEDLVNQFERNFNQKKRDGGQMETTTRTFNGSEISSGSDSRHQLLGQLMAEPPPPPPPLSERSSGQVFQQLVANPIVAPHHQDQTAAESEQITDATSSSSFRPTLNDSLVEMAQAQADLEDKHIHYDTQQAWTMAAALSPPPPSPPIDLSRQTLSAPTYQMNANYTLEPIRMQHEQDQLQVDEPRLFNDSKLLHKRHDSQQEVQQADNEAAAAAAAAKGPPPASNATSAPGRSAESGGQHQGRSMGGLTSRLPPYASYNQFHHRGADEAGPSLPPTPPPPPSAPVHSNDLDVQANATTRTISTAQSEQKSPGELAESISRISSYLVGGAAASVARQRAPEDSPTATTTVRPLPANSSYENLIVKEELKQQQKQRDELERIASKLAPINELPVDLSPIPAATYEPPMGGAATTGSDSSGGGQSMSAAGSEPAGQFYFSQAAFEAQQRQLRPATSSFYIDGFDNSNDLARQPAKRAGGSILPPPGAEQVAQSSSSASASVGSLSLPLNLQLVNRKTLEMVSEQIQQADSHLHLQAHAHRHQQENAAQGQHANGPVHQHKERSPSSHEMLRSGGGGGGSGSVFQGQGQGHVQEQSYTPNSYAASLINVTAPLLLPLSATEAMEASLASDQVARRHMMHQVSNGGGGGGGGSGATLAASGHESRPGVPMTPFALAQRTNNYYTLVPQASEQPQQRSPTYSRPANSFSPRPLAATSTSDSTRLDASSLQAPHLTTAAPALSAAERERMRLGDSTGQLGAGGHAPVPSQQASGFRSPNFNSFQQHLLSSTAAGAAAASSGGGGGGGGGNDHAWPHTTSLPTPSSYLSALLAQNAAAAAAASGRYPGSSSTVAPPLSANANNNNSSSSGAQLQANHQGQGQNSAQIVAAGSQLMKNVSLTPASNVAQSINAPGTTNGFITGLVQGVGSTNSSGGEPFNSMVASASQPTGSQQQPQTSQQVVVGGGVSGSDSQGSLSKRVFNLTRVEHISAECSNDLIRTVIIFNGTFKGIIYSSGYVRDPSCLYINGTGKTRYDFSIKLNQCGTLGRKEERPSSKPNEINRRDQVMWNTLSIQYNPIIEQEWDEHFRVSCEYGSDFWKTISFSPFNVETNTGAPVVFTVEPPQCQMEILKGHGMVGPRQEAVTGPVTVGDPLTLLIHMKSEKSGYDILVKNCIAHNGGQQKMQLIDQSGCVVNERFISPFRGTYNDNDLKHVTLYSYLKAFRFTGSPVLYLECEVHMCQSACPPQMCYWRKLSKRSTNDTRRMLGGSGDDLWPEGLDDSRDGFEQDYNYGASQSFRLNLTSLATSTEATTTTTTTSARPSADRRRQARGMRSHETMTKMPPQPPADRLSDRVSLFQALEVRQEREPDGLPAGSAGASPLEGRRYWSASGGGGLLDFERSAADPDEEAGGRQARFSSGDRETKPPAMPLMCYRRVEVFAILFTVVSLLLAAFGVTIGCCLRASSLKRQALRHHHQAAAATRNKRQQLMTQALTSLSSANLAYKPLNCSPRSGPSLNGGLTQLGGGSPSPTSSSASDNSSACSAATLSLVGNNYNAQAPGCQKQSRQHPGQVSNMQVLALDLASRRERPPPPLPPVSSIEHLIEERRRRHGHVWNTQITHLEAHSPLATSRPGQRR